MEEYKNFTITVTNATYSFSLVGCVFVFRSLKAAKNAIDAYYACGVLLPCEMYAVGNVLDGERGGAWMGI